MHNICVAQAVAEYFYFDLREASGPEIDDSQQPQTPQVDECSCHFQNMNIQK